MAVYSLTLSHLRLAVQHALGKPVDAQFGSDIDFINEAVQQFGNGRAWPWRRGSLSLNTVAAQNYIALPADFAQIDNLWPAGSASASVAFRNLEDIVQLRASNLSVANSTWQAAISWTTQANATSLPTARLELFPTPATSVTAFFVGHYYRVIAKMTTNTDVPDLPAQMHPALRRWVRAYAMSLHDMPERAEKERLACEREVAAAMDEAGGIQRQLGPLRGGIKESGERLRTLPTITLR